MHHGDNVVILKDKIMISEKELAPIGILDQSRCWGRWVPDRRAKNGSEFFSHLIVSPFEITSWPILFRITVILEDREKKVGNLVPILKLLKKENLNILSAEGTPTGHRHAIINIIVEASRYKVGGFKAMFDAMIGASKGRLDGNGKLEQFVHKRFVPEMLNYTWVIKKSIIEKNFLGVENVEWSSFLRETFLNRHDIPSDILRKIKRLEEKEEEDSKKGNGKSEKRIIIPERKGLIYDYEVLKKVLKDRVPSIEEGWNVDEILEAGKRQVLKAVSCTWLQNHAFYWLYGMNEPKARILRFESRHSSLRPDNSWSEEYAEMVAQGGADFPYKSISTTNYTEQYIRVLFSRFDKQQRTRKVKIPYRAAFTNGGNTKGLLHTFCDAFAEKDIALRSVVISTEARDAEHERGTFTFLATDGKGYDAELGDDCGECFSKILDARITDAIKTGKENADKIFNRKAEGEEKETAEKAEKENNKNYTCELKVYKAELNDNGDKPKSQNAGKPLDDSHADESDQDFSVLESEGKILSRSRRLMIEMERIIPFQSRILFLSTKFDWLEQERPNLLGKLQRKGEEYGFDVWIAHHNFKIDKDKQDGYKLKKHLEHLFESGGALTENIIRGLRAAEAFIQIIPKRAFDENDKNASIDWLLFEYGGAKVRGLPSAICVDTSGNTTRGQWQERLKIQSDRDIFPFSSGTSDSKIIENIESAFEVLAKKPYSTRDENR